VTKTNMAEGIQKRLQAEIEKYKAIQKGDVGRFQFTDAPCLYAIFSHFRYQTFITVNYYFICHNCISNLVTLCYLIAYSACFHRYDILCTVVRLKLPTSAYTGRRK